MPMNNFYSAKPKLNRAARPDRAHKPNRSDISGVLNKLGLERENPGAFCGDWFGSGKLLVSVSPIDGQILATVRTATSEQYERTVKRAQGAFEKWQTVPAPRRGELARQLG